MSCRISNVVLACTAVLMSACVADAIEPFGKPGLGVYAPFGLDLAGSNLTLRPGEDFYRYANGTWLDRTQIPPDRPLVSVDQQIEEAAQDTIRAILEEADGDGSTPDLAKARTLYRSFLDTAGIDSLTFSPIAGELGAIRAASNLHDLAVLMGRTIGGFGGALFDLTIRSDPKGPNSYAVTVRQGGLGLPDRAYYLDHSFLPTREAYRTYLARLLALVGWGEPDLTAMSILAFETAIAEKSWSGRDARDAALTSNPIAVADLSRGSFPWRTFLAAAGLERSTVVIVGQPSAVAAIGELAGRTPTATLQAWQAVHLIDDAAPFLSSEFVRAHDAFRSGALLGMTETPPRWRQSIALVDTLMGEAVGQAYVERTLPATTKSDVEAMVETLRQAFADRIGRLEWLSQPTRERALDKLARMGRKVAHPDRWRSYATLQMRPGDLFGNVRSARAFEWAGRVDRLDGPVVRDEWFITPQTADAAYSVSLNELVLPGAELQAPFFHPVADPAVNYGGIGAIIGHEMTHGFDDDGRRFDATGQMAEWWSHDESAAFDQTAGRLAAQMGQMKVLPGLFVDGPLTLNEAIADLGGASIALDAYHRSLGGQVAPVIGGLTGDQRFFLAFAQAWRWKAREPVLRRRVAADPHAPPEIRVNATVRNMDAWYTAFGIQPGDAIYLEPSQRVRLW